MPVLRQIAASTGGLDHWLLGGAYVGAYVALDWASYIYPIALPLAITPWNPQPGLSLAFLLRCGVGGAPWLFVAALAAELLVRGSHLALPLLVATCTLPALGYTALAVALARRPRFDPDLDRLRDGVALVSGAAVASGLLALAFTGAVTVADVLPRSTFGKAVAQYWIGDLVGIVVTTPLLLVLTRVRWPRWQGRWPEWVAQFALVGATLWIVFASGWFEELKLFYLLFLPLIWVAMRQGVEGTVVATLLIQIGLIVAMRAGGYGGRAVLEFQCFLLAVAVGGLFLGITVTERRAIALRLRDKERELEHTLRLSAASEMTSALAHELNQPLTALAGYVRLCQLMLAAHESPPALKETMDKAAAEVTRAGDVVRRLRDFFRSGSGHVGAQDVVELLRAARETSAARLARHGVRLVVNCPAGLPHVLADRVQIEIVLHNLIGNAIEALVDVPASRREVALSAAMDSEGFVRIDVADSGPGVSEEIAPHLFAPFATTKVEGMGLGLAISRSMVEALGGRLSLAPSDRGATFSFTLPIARHTP